MAPLASPSSSVLSLAPPVVRAPRSRRPPPPPPHQPAHPPPRRCCCCHRRPPIPPRARARVPFPGQRIAPPRRRSAIGGRPRGGDRPSAPQLPPPPTEPRLLPSWSRLQRPSGVRPSRQGAGRARSPQMRHGASLAWVYDVSVCLSFYCDADVSERELCPLPLASVFGWVSGK